MADSKCHSFIEKCTRWEPDERFQSIEELEIFLTDFPHSKSRINKPIISFSSYKLPGFRTRKLWKMALALLGYLFCFYLCITVTFTETKKHIPITGSRLWYECLFYAAGPFKPYFL